MQETAYFHSGITIAATATPLPATQCRFTYSKICTQLTLTDADFPTVATQCFTNLCAIR